MLVRARLVALAALVAAAAALALAVAPVAQAQEIERAAAALKRDNVYVGPGARPALTGVQVRRLRERIAGARSGPVYVAVLSGAARNEAGGSVGGLLRAIAQRVRRQGTYAVVAGGQFRAASTTLPEGAAARAATDSFREHGDEGLAPTLLDFVDRVGDAARGDSGGGSGSGSGGGDGGGSSLVPLALLGLIAAGGVGFFAVSRQRRRREERAELDEVKSAARTELIALGEDLRALDLDVEMPGADPRAKEEYGVALDRYANAEQALDMARRPENLAGVSQGIEEGRFAMASAKARLRGDEPPERRPPCFFDPRHGPSARDVQWTPPGGAPRAVPACEADAQRVEAGEDPQSREIAVGGRMMPYWAAPPMYQPFAGGYFGGFGGGLLPGLLIGSMLGGAMSPGPVFIDGGDAGADGGDFGDGDWGGGDFGGGDFGGGDFGGGDFGGGDFGGGDFG